MARVIVLLLMAFTVWTTSPAHVVAETTQRAPQVSPAPQTTTTTYKHTKTIVRSFFRAYNRHDLHAVLTMVTPSVRYTDCDWTTQQVRVAIGKAELKKLFQSEFVDKQQFLQLSVVASNPNQRYVAGAQFLQTTRSMQTQGMAPQAGGFKIVLQSPGFAQIRFFAGIGPTRCKR